MRNGWSCEGNRKSHPIRGSKSVEKAMYMYCVCSTGTRYVYVHGVYDLLVHTHRIHRRCIRVYLQYH